MVQKKWRPSSLRFRCQGSGKCCLSRGSYSYVYLTLSDRRRLALFLGKKPSSFTRKFCEKLGDEQYVLKEDPGAMACRFLEDRRCSVYEARPTQCRTWPFWPENMEPEVWQKEVAEFCPGVGKGPFIENDTLEKHLQEQQEADR